MCFLPASSCFRLSCLPACFPVGLWAPESGSSWPFSALPATYHLKGSTVISFVWNPFCLQDALHKKARHGIVKGPCGPAPSPQSLWSLSCFARPSSSSSHCSSFQSYDWSNSLCPGFPSHWTATAPSSSAAAILQLLLLLNCCLLLCQSCSSCPLSPAFDLWVLPISNNYLVEPGLVSGLW